MKLPRDSVEWELLRESDPQGFHRALLVDNRRKLLQQRHPQATLLDAYKDDRFEPGGQVVADFEADGVTRRIWWSITDDLEPIARQAAGCKSRGQFRRLTFDLDAYTLCTSFVFAGGHVAHTVQSLDDAWEFLRDDPGAVVAGPMDPPEGKRAHGW